MSDLIWVFTGCFCPKCGSQTVVKLPSVLEDNAGVQHVCCSCSFGFFLPDDGDYMDLEPAEVDKVITAAKSKIPGFSSPAVEWTFVNPPDGVYRVEHLDADTIRLERLPDA